MAEAAKANSTLTKSIASFNAHKGHATRSFNDLVEVLSDAEKLSPGEITSTHLSHLTQLLDKYVDRGNKIEVVLDTIQAECDAKEAEPYEKEFIALNEKISSLRSRVLILHQIHQSQLTNAPAPMQGQGQANSFHSTKINEALKPEKLTSSATLAEFRSWRTNFELYYTSNGMQRFSIAEQQGYLRSCIDLKLQQFLSQKIQDRSPIHGNDGCLEQLRGIFLMNIPVLTRRFNFFNCNQSVGEKFSDWNLRLQMEGQEADLANLSIDDMYSLRYVTGTSDRKLREEFLKQKKPTRQDLLQIAMSWEAASNVGEALGTTKKIAAAQLQVHKPDKYQGQKSYPDLRGKCYRCGQNHSRDAHCPAKGKSCHSCGKLNHFDKVCLGGRKLDRSRSRSRPTPKSATPSSRSSSMSYDRSDDRTPSSSAVSISSISRINAKVQASTGSSTKTPMVKVRIYPKTGTPFTMPILPDTGATESIISHDLVRAYGIKIADTTTRDIFAVNKSRLQCLGKVHLTVRNLDKYETTVSAYVTPDLTDQFIISWHAMIGLGIIPDTFPLLPQDAIQARTATTLDLDGIFSKFPKVFSQTDDLTPMKGPAMKIHLKDDVPITPTKIYTARNIPFAFRDAALKEIKRLVAAGILETVTDPTEWISAAMFIAKPDGSIRLVTDFTGLNKYVKRPVHPFPTATDIINSIPADSQVFAIFDAVKGYWQVELEENSRHLTTFMTPFGRFRYARAPMGLNASGDEFCRRGDEALSGLTFLKKIVDDIIIFAPDYAILEERITQVLQRCDAAGITLSRKKAQVGTQVKFAGYLVSNNGIEPDPDRTKAISNFPIPENITDLRSFFGLVNQLGQFTPDLAHMLEPLRGLLKPKNAFIWLPEHQTAFDNVKQVLTDPNGPILAHFDSSLPIILMTDASRLKGIGFALMQQHPNGQLKLVQCNSRFLSDTETRYAVCELETLAIYWAITKSRLYLAGTNFTVLTDHKPLVGIFNGTNLNSVHNQRIQRFMEQLLGFTFNVKYTPGKTHCLADALSRAPLHDAPTEDDVTIATVLHFPKDLSLHSLQELAIADANYQLVIQALRDDKDPKMLPLTHPARLYANMWDEISLDKTFGLLMYQTRLIIPERARSDILDKLHLAHQGISKTRALAKQLYYWPGISNDIAQMVSNCSKCLEHLPSSQPEPLLQTAATYPMESVSVDLAESKGHDYLIMADRYSGFPFIKQLRKTDTATITRTLLSWFHDYGFCSTLRSDGGPQFRTEFNQFCDQHGISHETSSAYNPQSNGHAEAAVKSMKKLLAKTEPSAFSSALLEWKNTPRQDGLSPAQCFFGRRLRTQQVTLPSSLTRLPDSTFAAHATRREERSKSTASNFKKKSRELPPLKLQQEVLVQNQKSKLWSEKGFIKQQREHGRSYLVDIDGKTFLRNRKFLKPAPQTRNVRFQV